MNYLNKLLLIIELDNLHHYCCRRKYLEYLVVQEDLMEDKSKKVTMEAMVETEMVKTEMARTEAVEMEMAETEAVGKEMAETEAVKTEEMGHIDYIEHQNCI